MLYDLQTYRPIVLYRPMTCRAAHKVCIIHRPFSQFLLDFKTRHYDFLATPCSLNGNNFLIFN